MGHDQIKVAEQLFAKELSLAGCLPKHFIIIIALYLDIFYFYIRHWPQCKSLLDSDVYLAGFFLHMPRRTWVTCTDMPWNLIGQTLWAQLNGWVHSEATNSKQRLLFVTYYP